MQENEDAPPPRPRKPKRGEIRGRLHLTPVEVARLMKAAAAAGRHGHRDSTMILLAFTHGFRVSELVALRRDQIDLETCRIHITRLKHGKPDIQPMPGQEVRELRKLWRTQPPSQWAFLTERGTTVDRSGFKHIVRRAGELAGLPLPVSPHMLRHSCGYKLANDGRDTRSIQDYLGHRNITHTVGYTALAEGRYDGWWDEGKG